MISPSLLRRLSSLVCLLSIATSSLGQPLINQTGRLPERLSGPVEMKFAIVVLEKNPARAVVRATVARGAVTALTLTQAGSGYEKVPEVSFVAEAGHGARARAVVSGGHVTGLQLLAGGQGFVRPPEVVIAKPTAKLEVTTLWSNDGTSVAGSQPERAVTLNVLQGTYGALLGYTGLPNMAALPPSVFAAVEARLRVWYRKPSGKFIRVEVDQPLQAAPYADASGFAVSVASGSVTSASLANGAVTVEKLGDDVIAGTPIKDREGFIQQLRLVESATTVQRAIEREVWLAIRTDGRPGTGTADDPFDASTSAKFDALMRSFADAAHRANGVVRPMTIHLGPGTFMTMGSAVVESWPVPYPGEPPYPPIVSGWYMHSGWRLLGAGEQATVVRLESWPQLQGAPYSYGHTVISSADGSTGYWGDDCEVSGLTIDCNWQNLAGKPAPAMKLDAIMLAGDRVKIHNIIAENAYGNWANISEGFTIAWAGISTGDYFLANGYPDLRRGVSGGTIKNCHVRKWRGNYGVAIVAFTGPDGRGGLIAGNEVVGYHVATCAFQVTGRGNLVVGNRSMDSSCFMHLDAGTVYDTLVAQNVALNCLDTAIDIAPSFAESDFQQLTFQDNVFEVASSSPHPWVIHFVKVNGKLKNLTVRGNRLLQSGAGDGTQHGFLVEGVDGLTIVDNAVQASLKNGILTNADVRIRNNYTETGGIPPGLANVPSEEVIAGTLNVGGTVLAGAVQADGVTVNPGGFLQAETFAFVGDGSTGVIRGGQLTLGDTTTVSLDWLSRTLAGGAWSIGDGGFAFTGTGKADTLQALGLRQHAAALNKTSPQTLAAEGVRERVRWDAVLWDHDAMAGVADERLTAKTGGIYRVDFRCVTDPQRFNFELYKNGTALCPLFRGASEAPNASVVVELAAGDYLEVWAASFGGAFQVMGSSGGVLNTTFSLSLVREH